MHMIFSIWGSSEADLSGTLFKVAFQIDLFLTLLLFEMAVLCNLFCAAGGSAIGILLSMLCVIGLIIMIQRRKPRPFARTSEGWMRRLQTTQQSFQQGFLLELLVLLGLMFFRTLWFDVLLYCFKRNTSGSCDKVAAAPEWGIVPIDILFNLFRKTLAHLSG